MSRPDPEPEPAEPDRYLGRRIGAIMIDWAIASAISAGFFGFDSLATLAVFAGMTVILLATLGATIGHRLCGLRVYRADLGTSPVSPLQALIRTGLLLLVVPVAVAGRDGRSLHDAWAGTTIARFGAGVAA